MPCIYKYVPQDITAIAPPLDTEMEVEVTGIGTRFTLAYVNEPTIQFTVFLNGARQLDAIRSAFHEQIQVCGIISFYKSRKCIFTSTVLFDGWFSWYLHSAPGSEYRGTASAISNQPNSSYEHCERRNVSQASKQREQHKEPLSSSNYRESTEASHALESSSEYVETGGDSQTAGFEDVQDHIEGRSALYYESDLSSPTGSRHQDAIGIVYLSSEGHNGREDNVSYAGHPSSEYVERSRMGQAAEYNDIHGEARRPTAKVDESSFNILAPGCREAVNDSGQPSSEYYEGKSHSSVLEYPPSTPDIQNLDGDESNAVRDGGVNSELQIENITNPVIHEAVNDSGQPSSEYHEGTLHSSVLEYPPSTPDIQNLDGDESNAVRDGGVNSELQIENITNPVIGYLTIPGTSTPPTIYPNQLIMNSPTLHSETGKFSVVEISSDVDLSALRPTRNWSIPPSSFVTPPCHQNLPVRREFENRFSIGPPSSPPPRPYIQLQSQSSQTINTKYGLTDICTGDLELPLLDGQLDEEAREGDEVKVSKGEYGLEDWTQLGLPRSTPAPNRPSWS
ncbi:hypothetical protein BJ508DRAFT_314236 [Ascobolus immersus RN42]|uniref:Uncharacterized protein n=1 Tax=Ascobolus immersus RN42 TaxID=1160509 RepID=A0A3N4HFS0_ASCIM|nr:hypothetical protein BJ508DRAFT_314236 [Ascobolus immersus RN42]